ncbi:MAG: Cbb3-type cytochrome oxidase assembly protein CcoS [Bacteroidota bacterium]|nr:Cbb3-type cytochrome oxidase assembly protein CcoS [Bacteroidota bacterium]
MTAIIVLIALSLSLAILFLVAFLWAVKSEQYTDTYTPSLRILTDDGYFKADKNNIKINREI